MQRNKIEFCVITTLVLAICLPTGFSVWFAHKQSEEKFVKTVQSYTANIIMRTDAIVNHAEVALKKSNDWQGAICSKEHQKFMQNIAFEYNYIKAVLWVNARETLCSSGGVDIPSGTFPPPMRITKGGDYGWYLSVNTLDSTKEMVALGKGNSIVLINPGDFVDVGLLDNSPVDVAIIGLIKDTIFSSSKPLDLNLWIKIKNQNSPVVYINNAVYNVHYIPELNLAVVGWSSSLPLKKAWHNNLWIMIPIGLLISIIASFLMLRVLRRLQSPYYALLDAIDSRDISVNYQPIVCLQTNKVVGAEALARWRLSDGKYLSPEIFIPLAEQTGLIVKLTELVLINIFQDVGKWLSNNSNMHISLNVTVDDLSSERFLVLLEECISRWNVSPKQIALELTERQFAEPEKTKLALTKFREKGHSVYIDDFGTGYSSLSYLQKLPIDVLKIDKAFINSWEGMTITPHIIEIAHTLGIKMVAEGIETLNQKDWLFEHGVQYGQGWLFSKALPKTEFILWSENNSNH
ncbi:TPA: EAL domain-containing protein [Salmonella enterica subsp. enterica serovar Enteritidis]|nr:EAL domain-containing protein [Salmonella enterica]